MGQHQSAMETCILSAVGNDSSLVATPSTPFYHLRNVHPYNLEMNDIVPIAVVYPQSAEDIAAIVACAGQAGIKVQARSGGHSFADHCIGGESGSLIVDMENFDHIFIDPVTSQLTVGAGLRLSDINEMLAGTGRTMAVGNVGHIGVGGHVAVGGIGSPSRMWGTVVDQLEEVQVVLANGTVAVASATQNTDLFWAMRGAGQHFGIATSFKFRTQPVPATMTTFRFTYKGIGWRRAAEAYKSWHEFVKNPDLDRRFACDVVHSPIGMIIVGTYFGPKEDFDKIDFSAIFPDGNGVIDVIQDYLGEYLHRAEDAVLKIGGKLPGHFYVKSLAINEWMSNSTIDRMIEHIYTASHGTLLWAVLTDLEGGAINDPAVGDTAFAQRNAKFYVQGYVIDALKVSFAAKNFLRGLTELIQDEMPDSTKGTYPGYIDPELDSPNEVYYGDNLPRLSKLKAVYDPKVVFWNPQALEPAY